MCWTFVVSKQNNQLFLQTGGICQCSQFLDDFVGHNLEIPIPGGIVCYETETSDLYHSSKSFVIKRLTPADTKETKHCISGS